MINQALVLALCFFLSAQTAHAHKKNFYVLYTMKNIARDVAVVQEPSNEPNPADVLDGTILNAIIRARSSVFLLQTVIDKRGSIKNGKFIKDEMTPAGLDEESDLVKAQKLLDLYFGYLSKAKEILGSCEQLLITELNKTIPENRDFAPAKALLVELESLISEAHQNFHP